MHPEITCEKLEYVYVGAEFNRKILKYGGIMIHSSAVEVDGKPIYFLLHVVQENRHIRSSGKNILVQIRRL